MKTAIARTSDRVERHTSRKSQERIEDTIRNRVHRHARGGRASIGRRLRELDREWDVERVIEANSSSLALGGTILGLFVSRWFFALPLAVTGFLLQHSLQGWCPPIPLLRRLGFRTAREIHEERYALKAFRGDFRTLRRGSRTPHRALAAARR
jgi:hypothetical protein